MESSIPHTALLPARIMGLPEIAFRWLFIVFFAIAFPIIFLPQHTAFNLHWLKFSLPFGLLYSSLLVHLILHISRIFKRRMSSFREEELQKILRRQIITQALATVLFGTCMGMILSLLDEARLFSLVLVGRNVTGSLLVVGIFLGIYDGLYWLNQFRKSLSEQEKLQRMNVQGQLDGLRDQVKPHFLFNSLNTLVGIIPEDPDLAIKFVENLSRVYRYILEIKGRSIISLAEEVKCVRAYLFLLEIRFGKNLQVTLLLDHMSAEQHVVPLCLQLLVENAVKHNIASTQKPLKIKIEIEGKILVVSNNLQLKDQSTSGTGTGLANIKDRYRLLADRQVIVKQTENQFRVSVPIIQVVGA